MTRRQMRQRPNLRSTARGRPHRRHLVYARTLNFGVRCCFSINAFLAMGLGDLLLEWEAESGEEGSALRVVLGADTDGDVHAADDVDTVVVDLGEDQLLGDPEGVVPMAVEGCGRQTAEVPDPGDGDGDEPVEKLPRPVTTQRHLGTDGHAL